MGITDPGTIGDLIADADAAGHEVTPRLIRDWTSKGLLDNPVRRSRGRGHGSKPALYRASQRMLLLTLLHHRTEGRSLRVLAKVPVALWLYFPTADVRSAQAAKAFQTWLGDPRSSKEDARRNALETTAQLASRAATRAAKRRLTNLLAEIAYTGELTDTNDLRVAIHDVFEPEFTGLARSVGHASAPLSTEAVVDIIRANLAGATYVTTRHMRLGDFEEAGRIQRRIMAEYIEEQPEIAAGSWGEAAGFYDVPTLKWLIEECCSQLLCALGLNVLNA